MRRESFVIHQQKLGEWSLNKIYAGRHWNKRKQDANFWHMLVKAEMSRQKIPKRIFQKPVRIRFRFNSQLDIDNHGYIVKLITDGLKGYLITDDTRQYVVGNETGFYDGDGINVEVEEAS